MQSLLLPFVYFLIYGWIGWAIDTAYRTYKDRRWASTTFFPIPFTPIYGLGAILVLALHPLLLDRSLITEWLAFSFVLGLFEYLSGWALAKVAHKRLWDYTSARWDVQGYTDLFHAGVWGILALVLVYVLHPLVSTMLMFLL